MRQLIRVLLVPALVLKFTANAAEDLPSLTARAENCWDGPNPSLRLEVCRLKGEVVIARDIPFSELRPK